jgi:hypothetical protein
MLDAGVVFLDLDGVLNNNKTRGLPRIYRYGQEFSDVPPPDEDDADNGVLNFDKPLPFDDFYNRLDPDCVRELNRITDTTQAKIVLSSSWRIGTASRFYYLKQYLKMEGVKAEIIGRTPDFVLVAGQFGDRGDEIQKWLTTHPVKRFVILDDECDMSMHMSKLVRTQKAPGLTSWDADRAIQLLLRS